MLQLKNVGLAYPVGDRTAQVLRRVNLTLPEAGLVLIAGPSGSGKTALLRILAGAELPSRGELVVDGEATGRWNENRLASWRRRCGLTDLSLLLPDRTVLENAEVSASLSLGGGREVRENAAGVLGLLGLEDLGGCSPAQLSDQERWLAALACAAARDPEVLLVDEPGILEGDTRRSILGLLRTWAQERLVVVTSREKELFDAQQDVTALLQGGELTEVLSAEAETPTPQFASPAGLSAGGRLAMAVKNLGSRRSQAAARLGGVFAAVLAGCLALSALQGARSETLALQAETLAAYPIVLTADNVADGDLDALGTYLETEMDIHNASLQRTWAVAPTIYALDPDGSVRQVNPETTAGTSLWTEIPDGESLRSASYELVAGRWPTRFDEAAVLLDAQGNIDRGCLEALGLSAEEASAGVSYTQMMRLAFRVLLPTDRYVRNVDGTWGYIGDDPEVMAATISASQALKITGVLKPASRNSGAGVGGAVYLSDLTDWVKTSILSSRIVTAQTGDPLTDVLTARAFDASAHATDPGVQRMTLQRYVLGLSVAGQKAFYERMTGREIDETAAQDSLLRALDALSDEAITELYVREIESGVSPGSYEDNLRAFGALDADTVIGLRLYAGTFAGREELVGLLDRYASRVTYADEAADVVSAGAQLMADSADVYPALTALCVFLTGLGAALASALPVGRRRGETAALRALGLPGGAARGVLLWEELILSGLGAAAGALLALALGKTAGGALFGIPLGLTWTAAAAMALGAAALSLLAAAAAAGDVSRCSPVQASREAW